MKLINNSIKTSLLAAMLSGSLYAADCTYELFSISSTKHTRIIDFVEQLSDECDLSIIVRDPNADEFLDKTLNKTNFNNLTINEILDIILKENGLSYTLQNNLLRISYLDTKVYNIDYILSQRKSKGSTDVTLSSEGAGVSRSNNSQSQRATIGEDGLAQGGGSAGKSGIKIESEDEVMFWHELDLEFQKILNRPEDLYIAEPPVINKNAGMVTVTATSRQLERFEKYLANLQEKVKLQVLIDVQLLSVTMNNDHTTGVDWSQLYKLQNITSTFDGFSQKNISFTTGGEGLSLLGSALGTMQPDAGERRGHAFQMSAQGDLNEVIKFLKTQGDVASISNPKVLTLNNQPAIISAGTEYFYKIKSTETLAGGNTGTTSENEDVQSVFAGVLLDITPEISSDRTITLKVNPSLSETAYDISNVSSENRTMPPDLKRRQLSSVVTVKDGDRVILGGLINTNNIVDSNKVPILGDIPILNYLFKYESKQKQVQELVMVIEPKIIDKDQKNASLADFGYQGISSNVLKSAKDAAVEMTTDFKE